MDESDHDRNQIQAHEDVNAYMDLSEGSEALLTRISRSAKAEVLP